MSHRRKPWMVFFLLVCVIAQTGCLALVGGAALGSGAYAYHKGKVAAVVEADFADSWRATNEALVDLGLPLKAHQRNQLAGSLESATHTGSKITISISEQPLQAGRSSHCTTVSIRVGMFGDAEYSERILEQIRLRLGSRQPPSLPEAPQPAAGTQGPPPIPAQERIPPQ